MIINYEVIKNIVSIEKEAKRDKVNFHGLKFDSKKNSLVCTSKFRLFIKEFDETIDEHFKKQDELLQEIQIINKNEYCRILFDGTNFVQEVFNKKDGFKKKSYLLNNKRDYTYPDYNRILIEYKQEKHVKISIGRENLLLAYDTIFIEKYNESMIKMTNDTDDCVLYTMKKE